LSSLSHEIGTARTILYVHGIGNKPIPSILKCQWDQALFGFDLGERSRLAYWVNREFYPEPNAGTCQSGDTITLEKAPTGRALNVEEHLEATSIDDEVDSVAGPESDAAALREIARCIDSASSSPHLTSRPVTRGVRAQELVTLGTEAAALPLPLVLRRWITRTLTRAFVRDVNDYLYVEARRDRMRESVLERLRVGGGPFIIVAHSLGSVIAYDVLSRLSAEDAKRIDVRLLVTVGSPLGITEIQDEVKRHTGQRKLAVPKLVRRWLNVADPLDPVAFDKKLADDFARGGALSDVLQWNEDSPRHPHSGTGYLHTRPVREAVREQVDVGLFQPVASFVIARDVVRELENHAPMARHKVLIELANAAGKSSESLDGAADSVIEWLERGASSEDRDRMRIERLRRFVAADLTREEAEAITTALALRGTSIKRVWRNAQKHALLDVSVHTVQALAAHTGYRATGRGIAWAVLDSGIRRDHPHFAEFSNIAATFDCTRRGTVEPGDALDENGHGTHVGGIIAGRYAVPAAAGGVPHYYSGIAPEAMLHIYKVLDKEGSGEDAWIIKALDHIAATNERAGKLAIQGVNLSLGGSFDQSVYGCGHSPLCSELRRLWRQGVVVVIAAGNEGFVVLQTLEGTIDANMDLSIGDPANLEEAIAVGSVHKENPHTYGVSYFSSRGPTADGRQKPDLVAPGERIMSCRHRFPERPERAEQLYVEMSGTSMAAPHVSGIVAAFLSMRREFIGYPDRVKALLLGNCTDLSRDRPQQGAGMPNLVKMLVNT